MAQVVHRSLDGRRMRLAGPLDLSAPATSVLGVAIGGRPQEFTSGLAALGDDVAAALGADGFDEELSYAGGTLLVGRLRPYDRAIGLVEDMLVAVWRGGKHCFFTQLYATSTAALLGMLRTLRVEEFDDGLALTPTLAGGSELTAPATVIKQVPALGLLELSPLTNEHVKSMPGWKGLSTPAGELFADSLTDGKPYYVLAARDTWTTLVPESGLSGDRLAERVGQLTITMLG
jgi:hypothetical protein